MSKIAVVYWSGTGNTEAMANAVADGVNEKVVTQHFILLIALTVIWSMILMLLLLVVLQ